MRRFLFHFAAILISLNAVSLSPAAEYLPKGQAGGFAVESVKLELRDEKRNREVPIKIYHPKGSTNALPVIVFSHGLGGSRDGYELLGRHWASHGYITVHLQHLGSDEAVWRGQTNPVQSMKAATLDVRNSVNRPLDVTFVVDELERLGQSEARWRGKFDLKRLGMAGHSFGAYTTLAIGGQQFMIRGEARRLMDARFKALLPMSSPVPARNRDEAFAKITLPTLHMTGTEDVSPINDTTAGERRIPFEKMHGPDNFLLVFQGGDHMVFSGRSGRGDRSKDEVFHELIKLSSTAFWDAYLRDDAAAKAWLKDGNLKQKLGGNGTFETGKAGRP